MTNSAPGFWARRGWALVDGLMVAASLWLYPKLVAWGRAADLVVPVYIGIAIFAAAFLLLVQKQLASHTPRSTDDKNAPSDEDAS